ncbi:MAG: hypothetical protein Q8P18_29800 [Pseudomonadota bacterium]|nr:hypothetical protein [Pseudomonadota bacterium]
MTRLRVATVLGALAVNGVLAAAPGRPSLAWLHPMAPPLTHIPEMGEPVLGSAPPSAPSNRRGLAEAVERAVRAVGTPTQQRAVDELRRLDEGVLPAARRAMTLRLAVQADAIALAEALGPARVGAIVADKDGLSTRIGEGRAWASAIERMARP